MTVKKRIVAGLDREFKPVLLEEQLPRVKRGEVLLRVRASMISPGTQLGPVIKARRDGRRDGKQRPLGYQNAGEVIAVGAGVRQFKKGDRVSAMGGGALHSTHAVVPQNLCCPIPEGIDYAHASAMNLVLTAVNAMRRAEPQFGEYVLVVGMGLVGQLTAQVARIAGLRCMAWDRYAGRLNRARRAGLDCAVRIGADDPEAEATNFTSRHGFDVAVVAFGGNADAALQQVVKVMKVTPDTHRMGRIILVGGAQTACSWGASLGNLDLRSAARTGPGYHDKQWELGLSEYPPVFVRWTTRSNMEMAFQWMSAGLLKMEPLITHRLPLKRFGEGVEMLINKPARTMGVVLEC